jgi:hypothetical protein
LRQLVVARCDLQAAHDQTPAGRVNKKKGSDATVAISEIKNASP